ncbi:hypothetical protein BDV95DRAFT_649130 [Massariosphaeria phaeospora]|uniref:Uncharacterized protein n=1 Tax=Massariosphaeria phaeospora TaxID=100035 RepID=A0A7C8M346_9PLEO|nr:hypothetical protein BDV95DRAFT_649130 [Massariosphaeria phaeospora]
MSELDDVYVHRGLWTNWSQGPVLGRTITTDTRTGIIVISILAILSSVATTHLWHIVIFALHQIRARGCPSDLLFWQQQAILRTLPAPSALMAENVNLWWIWRKRAQCPFLRCFGHVLLAFVYVIGALSATISTSFVVQTSNVEVLVNTPFCNKYIHRDQKPGWSHLDKTLDRAASYRNRCYGEGVSLPETCHSILIQPRLLLQQSITQCPFSKSMCTKGHVQAISVDTGLLDLTSDLGLNLPRQEAVKIRKKTTCTVVPVQDHLRMVNASTDDVYRSEQEQGFGFTRPTTSQIEVPAVALGKNLRFSRDYGNLTFIFKPPNDGLPLGYGVKQVFALATPSNLTKWDVVPELKLDDADTVLVAIDLRGATYIAPVEDILFSAHRSNQNNSRFFSDRPVGLLGCTQQYQYCIARPSQTEYCTQLRGALLDIPPITLPSISPLQKAALKHFITITRNISSVRSTFGGYLNATASISPMPGLPPDQWVHEVIALETQFLSLLQVMFTDHATGYASGDGDAKNSTPPVQSRDRNDRSLLCNTQKMRKAGGFANINYFGLVFIIVMTTAIVLLDLYLLKILLFLSKFHRAMVPRLDRWIQDGILQLQRRAFEAETKGSWGKIDQEVPVTTTDEKLAELSHASLPQGYKVTQNFATSDLLAQRVSSSYLLSQWGADLISSLSRFKVGHDTTDLPHQVEDDVSDFSVSTMPDRSKD